MKQLERAVSFTPEKQTVVAESTDAEDNAPMQVEVVESSDRGTLGLPSFLVLFFVSSQRVQSTLAWKVLRHDRHGLHLPRRSNLQQDRAQAVSS